jgi:hypothetical protein
MRFLGIAVLRAKRNVYHNLIKQKRQKLYARVKKRSVANEKAAKLKNPKFYRLFLHA